MRRITASLALPTQPGSVTNARIDRPAASGAGAQ